MTDDQRQFHLREFDALRKEIEFTLAEFYNIQRYAIVAAGAVWAWLATRGGSLRLPWMIPVLFVACGWARQLALFEQLHKISDYILILEDKFLNDRTSSDLGVHNEREPKSTLLQHKKIAPWGWEHSYHKADAQWR